MTKGTVVQAPPMSPRESDLPVVPGGGRQGCETSDSDSEEEEQKFLDTDFHKFMWAPSGSLYVVERGSGRWVETTIQHPGSTILCPWCNPSRPTTEKNLAFLKKKKKKKKKKTKKKHEP